MSLVIDFNTSHNFPATAYTINDATTGRADQTSKRVILTAADNTVLLDTGDIDINIDTFTVSIDANWITTNAIVSVSVTIAYSKFGDGTNAVGHNFLLPTLANIKQ